MPRHQPPLPPGPPPRSYRDSRDARDSRDYRDSRDSSNRMDFHGDSYRPGGGSRDNHYSEPRRGDSRGDMYQFSGSSYDSGSYNQSASHTSSQYTRNPPPPPGTNSYRPAIPQSGFDFRFDAPPAIDPRQYDDRRDYEPRPARQQYRDSENRNRPRHAGAQGRAGARGGYRGRAGPRQASDRAFLKTNREPTPELMPGMDAEIGHSKFQALDGLSDSEEADMDLSDSDASNDGQPKKKVATDSKAADGDTVPRWSNPDPYTALPPPDESQRKKKDVVKLIRKARVETGGTVKTEAAAEDFISFDFGDNEEKEEEQDEDEDEDNIVELPQIPTGPRYSHRENIHKVNDTTQPQPVESLAPVPVPIKNQPPPIDLASDPALGNRKRTRDDEIKGPPLIHKPTLGKKNPPASGKILAEWKTPANTSGTPWIDIDHSKSANMGVWLHKEIMDFYYHVKPRRFEQVIRTKLVNELRSSVKKHFGNADIQCFGSFMAGLYLPTADMDLVCLSNDFMDGYGGTMATKSALFRFRDFLNKYNLALKGSIEVISGAKVPIVKYVDRVTGLKVDVSFENDTGVIANKTFQNWKAEFPAMPILVTLIKHFLAMRGLNEPVNGGIGGFSTICLVVSLLQHMPQVQSRNMLPEHHLGEILMEFFDLYGNQFNVQTTAIQLKPPALVRKDTVVYRNVNAVKFSIIDPNRSDNDIAGGSSNTATIIKTFSQAYDQLQARMGQLQYAKDPHCQSILEPILAGNYRSFELQRDHLAHIHDKLIGPVDDRTII
ncbi:hypothetical protein BP5796_07797 [Coleophoma crateriformis]|uniref:polynucleotide adenylyltransferase n=1 Tax=Coleophoma crateriformis TaxID=565419 RepID=A0A3D8RCI1_9HELO|nr:hypothetical protein BP5796_07797 [Coleophoma crateriformis]